MLRMKNIQFGTPSDPWGPSGRQSRAIYLMLSGEARPICVYVLKLILVFHHLSSVVSKQLCASTNLEYNREVGTS